MPHTSIQKLRERMTPEARKRATLKAVDYLADQPFFCLNFFENG